MTVECVIASRHHRVVIGTKWSNINDISQRYNVTVKFPDRSTTQSTTQEGLLLLLLLLEALSTRGGQTVLSLTHLNER